MCLNDEAEVILRNVAFDVLKASSMYLLCCRGGPPAATVLSVSLCQLATRCVAGNAPFRSFIGISPRNFDAAGT